MVLVLVSVGAVLTVLGLAALLFGIPYNEFGLGNTLIAAGTTATTGGLLLIGLAMVLRELVRLQEALATRTTGRPETARAPEPSSAAFESAPSATVAAERLRAAPPAPRTAAAPSELPPPPPLRAPQTPAPLRHSFEPEPAPFSPPRTSPAAAASASPPPLADPDSFRLRPLSTARGEAGQEPPRAPGSPSWERDPLGESASTPERKRLFGFTRRRQTVSPDAEAPFGEEAPAETGEAAEPPPRNLDRSLDRRPERGPDRDRPAFPPRPPAGAPPAARSEPPAAPPQPSVSVLKSGEIDGMGYTLYTDGSIDAEFATGTLRFSSIEDLRRHLEENAG